MDDCVPNNLTEQEDIINSVLKVKERYLCVKTVSGKEYTFRVTENQLMKTYFRYVKPVEEAGVRWYAISQYHIAHNRVIELYISTLNTFRILYKDTGVYEEVISVY